MDVVYLVLKRSCCLNFSFEKKKKGVIKHPMLLGLTEAIILKQHNVKVQWQSSCQQHVNNVMDYCYRQRIHSVKCLLSSFQWQLFSMQKLNCVSFHFTLTSHSNRFVAVVTACGCDGRISSLFLHRHSNSYTKVQGSMRVQGWSKVGY